MRCDAQHPKVQMKTRRSKNSKNVSSEENDNKIGNASKRKYKRRALLAVNDSRLNYEVSKKPFFGSETSVKFESFADKENLSQKYSFSDDTSFIIEKEKPVPQVLPKIEESEATKALENEEENEYVELTTVASNGKANEPMKISFTSEQNEHYELQILPASFSSDAQYSSYVTPTPSHFSESCQYTSTPYPDPNETYIEWSHGGFAATEKIDLPNERGEADDTLVLSDKTPSASCSYSTVVELNGKQTDCTYSEIPVYSVESSIASFSKSARHYTPSVASRQSHNEKERRRRSRMKYSCDMLRSLVPGCTDKTDKATVLEFTVQFLLHLQQCVGIKCTDFGSIDPEQVPCDDQCNVNCHGINEEQGCLAMTLQTITDQKYELSNSEYYQSQEQEKEELRTPKEETEEMTLYQAPEDPLHYSYNQYSEDHLKSGENALENNSTEHS